MVVFDEHGGIFQIVAYFVNKIMSLLPSILRTERYERQDPSTQTHSLTIQMCQDYEVATIDLLVEYEPSQHLSSTKILKETSEGQDQRFLSISINPTPPLPPFRTSC